MSKSGPVVGAAARPLQFAGGADAVSSTLAEDMVDAIRCHPCFPSAMRESAGALVQEHARNRLLNRLISDRGRALFGILALYLHFHGAGGLTASRMADLAEELGVCSRGRVKALLVLLRWAGYLSPAPSPGDPRSRPLAPTGRMQAAYRVRWQRQLEVIAPMVAEAGAVAHRLDDPAMFGDFAVAVGGVIRSGFRILDHCPAIVPVAERDNGLLVLLRLAVSAPGFFAGDDPFALSVTEIAAAVRVSRSHALNLLREAERHGLIERGAPRTREGIVVRCRPLLADSLAGFFAATYAVMAAAAIEVSGRARP